MKKVLHIIPHSHWDREWYLPFDAHRARLLDLFDTLIPLMEENVDYTYYHMDGQYVVVEDYLEIRPAMRERLLKLIRAGRIVIGPWYVLQDEYLTSGEANVRNLLYGMRLCRALGAEPAKIGYFPDAFGNISQAPQILRGFGFDNAVFGRGINDVGDNNQIVKENGITKSELIWRSPDGSEVIGVMFANWYCNAMELPDTPDALRERLQAIVASTERFALTDHLLGMNGCDHQPIQTNLHRVIALANEVQDDVTVKQSNFEDYIAQIRPYKDRFPLYEGEINGQLSAGACPLICTASAHVDIKQKNHNVQHLLSGIAEPLGVLSMLCGGKYDRDLFLHAWKTLMQNHPHDSICTCSCDAVYEEMKTRFAKSEACATHLCASALDTLATAIDTSEVTDDHAVALFTLSPNAAVTTVQVNVDFDPAEKVEAIAIFDEDGNEVPATTRLIKNQFSYTLPRDRFRRVRYVDRFAVEMQVAAHGIGHRILTVKKQAPTCKTAIRYTARTAENAFLRIHINENGTLDVTDKRTGQTYVGQNLFEDTRDCGNLYNYIRPQGDVAVTSENARATITLDAVTPFSVTFRIDVPMAIDADVTTFVTLSDHVARVDFKTVITNRAENHRLRALFSSNLCTEHVFAEGQFDVIKRNIHPAETWKNPCNAQRMQAFVALESETADDALMLATRGICEYEALRDGHNTLALTLLRAVGEIGDWGVFPTPAGQKIGTWTLEYAMLPYTKETRSDAYSLGYGFAYPSAVAVGTTRHAGILPPSQQYARFDNAYVRMSALKQSEDGENIILRLFNTAAHTVPLTVELSPVLSSARLTNLAEEEIAPLAIHDGRITLDIPAKKIVTVEFGITPIARV